jgi:hypothetical protein
MICEGVFKRFFLKLRYDYTGVNENYYEHTNILDQFRVQLSDFLFLII